MEYIKGLGLDIPYMNIQMREYGLVKGGAILKQALEVSRASKSEKYNEMNQPLVNATQSCLMGKATAKDAFHNAAKEIDDIMN